MSESENTVSTTEVQGTRKPYYLPKFIENFDNFVSQEMLFGLAFAIILIQSVISYAADLKQFLIRPILQIVTGRATIEEVSDDFVDVVVATIMFILIVFIVWVFISGLGIKFPSLASYGKKF